MKSLMFIDHDFHRSTKSSDFFVEILQRHFTVDKYYVNPSNGFQDDLIETASYADIVVLWQLDYMAPIFLSLGIPTVVIPMYDGSSNMPDLHWVWMSQCRLINFSFAMHMKTAMLGCNSLPVKYFTPPVEEKNIATFEDGLRVFLWQRRPNEGINLDLIETLFGDQLRAVHIHDVPDDRSSPPAPLRAPSEHLNYTLTRSEWLSSREEYEALLAGSNVFVAPRLAEGIGMALLEAMGRGMLVVANDMPTHNEYVSNWLNGVLFNVEQIGWANFDLAPQMGRMAWRTAQAGRERWEARERDIVAFIDSTPKPASINLHQPLRFARELAHAYHLGDSFYTAFLVSRSALIETMAKRSIASFLPDGAAAHALAESAPRAAPQPGRGDNFKWVESFLLSAGDIERHLIEGDLLLVNGAAWAADFHIGLGVHFDPTSGSPTRMAVELTLPDVFAGEQTIIVSADKRPIGVVRMTDDSRHVSAEFPLGAVRADCLLSFQTSATGALPGVGRPISFGLKGVQFQ